MTLHDRDAIKFYMEGAQQGRNYQVVPMDVSMLDDELESPYTYRYDVDGQYLNCAIGKVKGA